jgi:hypothetical protein
MRLGQAKLFKDLLFKQLTRSHELMDAVDFFKRFNFFSDYYEFFHSKMKKI